MTERKSDDDVVLAKTMLARAANWRGRMVSCLIHAIVFAPIAGWAVSAVWFTVYACLQILEARLFSPQRIRVYGAPRGPVLTLLFANGLAFGSLGVFAVAASGVWGLVCGVLFVASSFVYAASTNQMSRPAYYAAAVPYLINTAIMLALGAQLGGPLAAMLAFGVMALVLLVGAHTLWISNARSAEVQARASAEADRKRFEAEASASAKTGFVAAVSHELRTPITAIMAGAEAIARDQAADPTTRSNAALIAEAGAMMRTMLSDLLDLSKMEAGRMSVETIDFNLQTLIDRTVALWATEAQRKGLELRCVAAGNFPTWMASDPTRLRQILNNLLSNAIKFTDKGAITLTVTPEQRGLYWLMRFSVSDSGRGMSGAQLERLFKPFEQTHVSMARTHGGTGLGLAISRELARLMGGDLEVVSHEGEGSVFTLEVGMVEVEGAAAPQEIEEDIGHTRVLVVDDHEVNRRAIALMLEPFSVALTTASSGEEALTLLAAAPFDVVLMDVYMPELDGRETCRRLRATPGPNQHTPVVACTASDAPQDLADCTAAGMNGHLAKPIDPGALHAAIALALSEAAAQKETPQPLAGAL